MPSNATSPSSDVALRFEFRLETDLDSGDSILMTLPGFSASPQRRTQDLLSITADSAQSVQYTQVECPSGISGCQSQGTLMPCHEAEAASLASPPKLDGEWREEEEVFSLQAKQLIPVGTHLTIDVLQRLRTPSYGLSSNSPLITIESTRDARDVALSEKKLAICTNPVALCCLLSAHSCGPDVVTLGKAEIMAARFRAYLCFPYQIPDASALGVQAPYSEMGRWHVIF